MNIYLKNVVMYGYIKHETLILNLGVAYATF